MPLFRLAVSKIDVGVWGRGFPSASTVSNVEGCSGQGWPEGWLHKSRVIFKTAERRNRARTRTDSLCLAEPEADPRSGEDGPRQG